MAIRYFQKTMVGNPVFGVDGQPIPFTPCAGHVGVAAFDDQDADGLRHIGDCVKYIEVRTHGITEITAEAYEALKKKPPLPAPKPGSGLQNVRIWNPMAGVVQLAGEQGDATVAGGQSNAADVEEQDDGMPNVSLPTTPITPVIRGARGRRSVRTAKLDEGRTDEAAS